MKRQMFAAAIAASTLLGSAPSLFAGVVMKETSTAKYRAGQTASQNEDRLRSGR